MSETAERAIDRKEFEPFDMTTDGFVAAKRWLKMMGLFDDYINGTDDTSGFGVVAFGNECFRQCEERKVGEA